MRELRATILIGLAVTAARLLSEASTCRFGFESSCGSSLMLLIPFIIAVYFMDSALAEVFSAGDKKNKIIYTLFSLPYLFFVIFIVLSFFKTVSVVTVEYILSVNLLYALIIMGIIYWVNNNGKVRRINKIFMVTLLLSFLIFLFI